LAGFFSKYKSQHFKKGQIIINAGDEPVGVYYLENGFARFFSISENGNELTINIFKPGSYFPMFWAIGDIPNAYFFEAVTDISVKCGPRDKLLEFVKSEPEIIFDFTRRLLVGFGGLLTRMEYLLTSSAPKKIASVFYMSARRFGQTDSNGKTTIQFPLTYQQIANLTSLTRETTSLEVKKLENQKVISREGHLWIINDVEKLKEEMQLHFSSAENVL
jgi:CRP/FNR family cyclic AMP-dependent transcriptional regulator